MAWRYNGDEGGGGGRRGRGGRGGRGSDDDDDRRGRRGGGQGGGGGRSGGGRGGGSGGPGKAGGLSFAAPTPKFLQQYSSMLRQNKGRPTLGRDGGETSDGATVWTSENGVGAEANAKYTEYLARADAAKEKALEEKDDEPVVVEDVMAHKDSSKKHKKKKPTGARPALLVHKSTPHEIGSAVAFKKPSSSAARERTRNIERALDGLLEEGINRPRSRSPARRAGKDDANERRDDDETTVNKKKKKKKKSKKPNTAVLSFGDGEDV